MNFRKNTHINTFRAKDWYNLGERYENNKAKMRCFKNAVAMDPLHGPAWHYLGFLYEIKGDSKMEEFCNKKAEVAYLAGLQRYQRNLTKSEWEYQNSQRKDDDLNSVNLPKAVYDVFTVIDNEIDGILENLARLYWNMHELEKAINCYDSLIELYPNWVKPHKTRGRLHYRLRNYDKAIDDLRFAIEVDDSDYESQYILGKAYSAKSVLDRADWYFEKARDAASRSIDCSEAKSIRAESSFELERYDESAQTYREILIDDPRNNRAWKKIAEIHLAKGEHKKAKRCFEKACRIEEQKKIRNDGDGE